MPPPSALTVRAPAKVNLTLGVHAPLPPGRPGAGLHPIRSWFSCIDLADEVRVERLPDGSPTRLAVRWAPDAPRPSPIDWPAERDLCVRAAGALAGSVGRELPCAIDVTKRIPVGGGLGGGSSDAGAVLGALNILFSLGLGAGGLQRVGAGIGSDVPFFVDDGAPARPARVSGLGDRIERATRRFTGALVLLVPPFGTPTGAVYAARDRLGAAAGSAIEPSPGAALRDDQLFNDLAEPAMLVEPRLRTVRDECARALGRPVHVTGSGSCLFCIDEGIPDPALEALRRAGPGVAVRRVRLC